MISFQLLFQIFFFSRCLKKNPYDRETSSELHRLSREYKPSREEEEFAESWCFEEEKEEENDSTINNDEISNKSEDLTIKTTKADETEQKSNWLKVSKLSPKDTPSFGRSISRTSRVSIRSILSGISLSSLHHHPHTSSSSTLGTSGDDSGSYNNLMLDFFNRAVNTKSFEHIESRECQGHKNSVVCMKIFPKGAPSQMATLVSGSRDCDIRVWKMKTFTKVRSFR